MNSIGDFAILEKTHSNDCDKLHEIKQAMHLLKVPITDEELNKCLHDLGEKKFDSLEFLSILVNHLLSRQRSIDGNTSGLVACTEGCGRSFKSEALKHHSKICKSVFQTKRSKFNSVKARQTEEMSMMAAKLGKDSDKAHIPSPQKKQRVPIAQMKKEFSKLQKVKEDEKVHELMLQCPEGCGRSFKSESLEKHAKVCKKVFQSKRSIFDSVKTRITEAMASLKEKFSKDDKKSHCHKDSKKKDRISIAQIKKQYYDELQSKKDQDVELKACLECNRKFKIESLEKHAKVCKKVFQQKRAKFDSAKARQTKEMAAVAKKKSDKIVSASKDQKKKERVPISQIKKQFLSLLHNDENKAPELMMRCPEGCGRTFKAEALEAHAHVCKNVFQHKRDKFDSESKRKSKDLRNFETIPYKKTKKNSRNHSGESHAEWKKQSNAFRSMVKALKAEKLRNEQPKWKTQSETLRSVVQAVHGLKKEKRVPLGTLSMNTQTDNVCCPNCGTKVNSIQKTN